MGGGGGSRSSSLNVPAYTPETRQLRLPLEQFLGGQGLQQSPYFSDLARMYQQTIGNTGNLGLPPDVAKLISQTVQTGLPSTTTPIQQTGLYQATLPEFQRQLQQTVIPGVQETFGSRGGLRSSDYAKVAQREAQGAEAQFISGIAPQAYQLQENAANRKLAGVGLAQQQALFPYQQMGAMTGAQQQLYGAQYPWLNMMYNLATGSAGQAGQSSSQSFNANIGGGGEGRGCCFIFLEGEGEITQRVRYVRDHLLMSIPGSSPLGRGYKRMARWLVPLMQRHPCIKLLTRTLMTRPLGSFARSLNKGLLPLAWFWVTVWYLYGRKEVPQCLSD